MKEEEEEEEEEEEVTSTELKRGQSGVTLHHRPTSLGVRGLTASGSCSCSVPYSLTLTLLLLLTLARWEDGAGSTLLTLALLALTRGE